MFIRSVDELSSLGRRIIVLSRIIFSAVVVSSLHRTLVGIEEARFESLCGDILFASSVAERESDRFV